jgi:hypothetical protein
MIAGEVAADEARKTGKYVVASSLASTGRLCTRLQPSRRRQSRHQHHVREFTPAGERIRRRKTGALTPT